MKGKKIGRNADIESIEKLVTDDIKILETEEL